MVFYRPVFLFGAGFAAAVAPCLRFFSLAFGVGFPLGRAGFALAFSCSGAPYIDPKLNYLFRKGKRNRRKRGEIGAVSLPYLESDPRLPFSEGGRVGRPAP